MNEILQNSNSEKNQAWKINYCNLFIKPGKQIIKVKYEINCTGLEKQGNLKFLEFR